MKSAVATLQIFIAAACLLFTASSCSMLDVDPMSKIVEADYYYTPEQAETALLGVYSILAGDNLYAQRLSLVYPVQSDESRSSSTTIDNSKGGLVNYDINPNNTELIGPFTDLYKGVARANMVIAQIRSMDLFHNGTASDKKKLRKYLGEALMLRALFYFDLVKIWGDVPFVVEPTDVSKSALDYRLPRTGRDEIYDYIIDDMIYAADSLLLSWVESGSQPERISRGAARGLLARICLHAAGYSLRWNSDNEDNINIGMRRHHDSERRENLYVIARDQLQKVIESGEHNLNPSYEQVFKNYMEFKVDAYAESMFEVGFTRAHNAGGGRIGVLNSGRQDEACRWSKGGGEILALPSCYIMYEPATKTKPIVDESGNVVLVSNGAGGLTALEDARWSNDKRRSVAICPYLINDTNVYLLRSIVDYTSGKWRRHWSPENANVDKDRTSINWVMLRYSDVLLMYAEAQYYLGNNIEARRKLNMVRRRGYGLPHNDGNGVTYADIPDNVWNKQVAEQTSPSDRLSYAIIRERMLELCFEGLRKYDLIRWNLLYSYVGKAKSEMEMFKQNTLANDVTYPHAADYSIPSSNTFYWATRVNASLLATSAEQLLNSVAQGNEAVAGIKGVYAVADLGQDRIDWSHKYFQPNKHELYPIPQSVLDANPKLTQCPAYK
jgi:hypothetical protein